MPNLLDLLYNTLGPSQGQANAVNAIAPPANAEVLSGDPGSAPAGLAGLVMNPKNAKTILQALKAMGIDLGRTSQRAEQAIAFAKLKYPALTKLPKDISPAGISDVISTPNSGVAGMYDSFKNTIKVFGHRTPDVPRTVNTVMHEVNHAYRNKGGELEKLAKEFQKGVISKEAYGVAQGWEEWLARGGGKTAQNTYNKFLALTGKL